MYECFEVVEYEKKILESRLDELNMQFELLKGKNI